MDKSLMDDKQEMAEIGRDCIESAYCFIHQKLRLRCGSPWIAHQTC